MVEHCIAGKIDPTVAAEACRLCIFVDPTLVRVRVSVGVRVVTLEPVRVVCDGVCVVIECVMVCVVMTCVVCVCACV